VQLGPRPPSSRDDRSRADDQPADRQAGDQVSEADRGEAVTDPDSTPSAATQGTAEGEPSGSVFESIGLGGDNLLPGMLFLGGIILALMFLMRGTKRAHAKRSVQTETMENPSERLAEMHRQASMTMEPASRALVEIESVGRRFSAMLDNKASRLESLLEDADDRIARLESALGTTDQNGTDTERTPGLDPEVLDRARVEEDRAERERDDARPLTISDAHEDRMSETQRRVWGLADEGCDAPEIASRLDIPIGHVELMLNLRRESG